MMRLIGGSACSARDTLIRIFRETHRACVCVEGEGDAGKSRCVQDAVAAVDSDLVMWEGEGGESTGGATNVSLHDACMKSILPHLLSSRGAKGAGGGGGGGAAAKSKSSSGRRVPITMLADNVHESFYQNRTIVQLLARKASTFSGKRLPGRPRGKSSSCLAQDRRQQQPSSLSSSRRGGAATPNIVAGAGAGTGTGNRPMHLVLTYDPSKLEARIVARLREMATCPPVQVAHPRAQEAVDALAAMLLESPHFPAGCDAPPENEERRRLWHRVAASSLSVALSSSSLRPKTQPSTDATKMAAPARLVQKVWERLDMSLFAAALACDDGCGGSSSTYDEAAVAEEAQATVLEDFAVDRDKKTLEEHCSADFGDVPSEFCYTGFKTDSMVNCLRRSPLRIDAAAAAADEEGRREERMLACSISEALLLSNVLVAGMRSDEDVDGRNMYTHAASSLYAVAAASCSASRGRNDKNLGVM